MPELDYLQTHGPRWWRPTAIARSLALRPRVYFAVATVALAAYVLPPSMSTSLRAVIAADAGFMIYLLLALWVMATFSHDAVRKRAARQDHGGLVILTIILLAIGSSFVAIASLLAEAKATTGHMKLVLAGLAGLTVVLSWLVTFFIELGAAPPSSASPATAPPSSLGETATSFSGRTHPTKSGLKLSPPRRAAPAAA